MFLRNGAILSFPLQPGLFIFTLKVSFLAVTCSCFLETLPLV